LKEVEASFNTTFLDVEIPAAFERTREGVERVAAIVRAMKEFAHPDAQEQSSADINHAIETTLLVARNEYKYAARVATELAELPPVVCNVSELNQVFLNLIVNAAHAIEAAGHHADTGIIRISTLAAGRWVRIVFEDNGCGIAPENLERIFDPFFTTKEVGKGTGQGLAIARSIIVEKHGGTIDVESTVRIGTRMTLTLPLRGRFAAAKS
jgi:signal transduction histidine kinase